MAISLPLSIDASDVQVKARRPLSMGKALVTAFILELMLLAVVLWQHPHIYQIPAVQPHAVTQVQFVRIRPPQPKPRVVKISPRIQPKITLPKPVPKSVIPVVKPKPKPRVVHHKVLKIHHVVKPHAPPPTIIKPKKTKPIKKAVEAIKPQVSTLEISAYARSLHVLIQKNLVILPLVQDMGLWGTVKVRFRLHALGGHAHDIEIVSGSSIPMIRQSALRTIKKLKFPAFPKSFGDSARTFMVTISINPGA